MPLCCTLSLSGSNIDLWIRVDSVTPVSWIREKIKYYNKYRYGRTSKFRVQGRQRDIGIASGIWSSCLHLYRAASPESYQTYFWIFYFLSMIISISNLGMLVLPLMVDGVVNIQFWSKQKSSWENFQLDLPATSRQQENRRNWGKAKSNLKPECEIVRWKSRQRLNTGGQFFDIKIKEMEIGRVLQIGNWRSCFFCNWLFPERRRSYEDYPHFMRRLRTFIEGKAETFYDFRRFL